MDSVILSIISVNCFSILLMDCGLASLPLASTSLLFSRRLLRFKMRLSLMNLLHRLDPPVLLVQWFSHICRIVSLSNSGNSSSVQSDLSSSQFTERNSSFKDSMLALQMFRLRNVCAGNDGLVFGGNGFRDCVVRIETIL